MGKSPGRPDLPPWRRAWNRLVRARPRPGPVHASYDEALRTCTLGAYEDDEIVRVVVDKNVAFRDRLEARPCLDLGAARTLLGVGLSRSGGRLRVLDLGGGGGYHFFLARTALGPGVDLRWNVVETPAMAKEAGRIAGGGLKFFSGVAEAVADLGDVDLTFTSGALHYCRDPLASLAELVDAGARHLFVTRTAFGEGASTLVSVQESWLSGNGPGPLPPGRQDRAVRYPLVFASRALAEELLGKRYDVRFALTEDQEAYVAGETPIHLYGWFCDLRRA